MPRVFPFEELTNCPLIVDAVYKGGSAGNVADDPISQLTRAGNQGGFRAVGSINNGKIKYTILYSSLEDPDWPDHLDEELGVFTYFGDNKKPGHLLHDTIKKGNVLLRDTFGALHRKDYDAIPPFLVYRFASVEILSESPHRTRRPINRPLKCDFFKIII